MTRQVHLHVVTPPRAVCVDGPRPCQWTECRYRIEPKTEADWVIRAPTCALDVADLVAQGKDPPTLEAIARWEGRTKERIRQCEELGLAKMTLECRRRGMPVREQARSTGSPGEQAIIRVLERAGKGIFLKDVAAALDKTASAVRHMLARMATDGRTQRDKAGRWSLV